MASNWSFCGVCDNRQISKPSVVWCSECDNGLCGDCKERHGVSKGTKTHDTVSIAEYKKLPIEVLQIAEVCQIHNEKYELFCRKHDCPCCKRCVKSHNDCKGLTDINEIIKNVKNSNAFYEIEQTLVEVFENIKRLSTNRKICLKSLENKKREIEAEIKQTRINVNHHLDKLQNNLMKELITVEQQEKSKIETVITTLKKKEKEITEVQESVASIKQHASELETFLTMKYIEKDVSVSEKFIKSIITYEANISCQINTFLQQFTANIQKFGEIDVSSYLCDFSLPKRKNRQAQIMVALPTRIIENPTLTLQTRIKTDLSYVQGCSLLPDGRMIFSCHDQDKISVFKSDGLKDFEIHNIGSTFDVVFIGNGSIAVTSKESNQIYIIDLKEKKIKKTIKLNSYTGGAVFKDGHLIYCAREEGLQMVNLRDESIINISNVDLPYNAYVTTFDDKLFYTDYVNDSVTCCDFQGNKLWAFRNKSVLDMPYAISVDHNGNLFVVGYSTHNVVVISPDGQSFKQLLTRDDGLRYPRGLQYDPTTQKLLVANGDNDAFLYGVK